MSDYGELDLGAAVRIVWSRRPWVLALTVLSTSGFIALGVVMTPTYRAETILVSSSSDRAGAGIGAALGDLGALASVAGLSIGSSGARAEEAVALLSGRNFTERFIRDKQLLPVLFPDKWNRNGNDWAVPPERRPSLNDGFKIFDGKVRTVTYDKKSGLIKLVVEWSDPVLAADWANQLVERANQEMRQRAINEAQASSKFLENELSKIVLVETRQAIGRLLEGSLNQATIAAVNPEYAFRVVDRALPADRDDPVRPRWLVLLVLGPVIGAMAGCLIALVLGPKKSS